MQEKKLVREAALGYTLDDVKLAWVDKQGRTWISDDGVDLQQRLCVIAHAGVAGHRGIETTYDILATHVWKSIKTMCTILLANV